LTWKCAMGPFSSTSLAIHVLRLCCHAVPANQCSWKTDDK
jgi:hypothetical protein